MSRRGDNIWHRKDGRWEARYIKNRVNGRAVYGYVYAKTYKEAKDLQTLRIKETEKIQVKTCDVPMSTVLDLFLSGRRHCVKESTYAKYRRDIDNHIRPYWGNILLPQITSLTIQEYTEFLLTQGNRRTNSGLSLKTTKDLVVLLKSILLYANQNELGKSTVPFVTTPKVNKADIQTLTREEQHFLEDYLHKNIDLPKMGVLLTLYTGLRIGELCALKWKNIDMKNQVLYIDKTIQRVSNEDATHSTRIIFDSPKSDASIRNIPILTSLYQYMNDCFGSCDNSENSFFLTGSSQYIEPRSLYRKYQSYLKECGLPNYTFHCLRHTFATRAIECGFDPKSLSEILGHSNVKITLDRYVHPNLELKRNHIELLSKVSQF